MYLLPLIHTLFPDLVFVHLIRDGRDMALSSNQNRARKHFEALFGTAGDPDNPNDAIRLWATANTGVAAWGERSLGPRYLLIRFEDLCAEPELWLARIIAAMTEAGPKHSRLRIHGSKRRDRPGSTGCCRVHRALGIVVRTAEVGAGRERTAFVGLDTCHDALAVAPD